MLLDFIKNIYYTVRSDMYEEASKNYYTEFKVSMWSHRGLWLARKDASISINESHYYVLTYVCISGGYSTLVIRLMRKSNIWFVQKIHVFLSPISAKIVCQKTEGSRYLGVILFLCLKTKWMKTENFPLKYTVLILGWYEKYWPCNIWKLLYFSTFKDIFVKMAI